MSVETSKFQWVRPPLQARSQKSLERILDAAESVIAEKGFEQATIAEIVRRGNSSVGAFYGRFREKGDLIRCLHDRFREEAFATIDVVMDPARWESASIEDILREIIPFLVTVYRERQGLIRALLLRNSAGRVQEEKGIPLSEHLTKKLRELLLDRKDEIKHPQSSFAVDLGLQAVMGTLDEMVLQGQKPWYNVSLSDPRLPEELVRLLLSYLQIPA